MGKQSQKQYKNGNKFSGETKNLMAEGEGILHFQNGNKYEG